MGALLNEVSSTDELVKGYKVRSMVQFIEKTYPKMYKEILTKIIDITPHEIKTLSYTKSQYKRLEKYCEAQGFKCNKHIN